MENNQQNTGADPELEKARKSMGNRIDPDPTPEPDPEEPKAPEKEPENKSQPDPEPKTVTPEPEKTPEVPEPPKAPEAPKRPVAYIPIPQYKDEKKQWENDIATRDARIKELETIAASKEGEQKDEDIEAFMESTGFDRETVEGFLKLAEKRLNKGAQISPEEREMVAQAQAIVKEKEILAQFDEEFKAFAEPELKKRFPNATPAQLEAAKDRLDKVAHSKEFHDKDLDFVIYKDSEELSKIFSEEEAPGAPKTKRTMESSRVGSGKPTSYTAKDFEGVSDFSPLADLDPAVRNELIKSFPTKTYNAFVQYTKQANEGLEVTRGGQKVILK